MLTTGSNAPKEACCTVMTMHLITQRSLYPKHFHNGSEDQVEESYIPDHPDSALRSFLKFVEQRLIAAGE